MIQVTTATRMRIKARRLAMRDQFKAGASKPISRAHAKSWPAPMRQAMRDLKSGTVDSLRGYPVTRPTPDDEWTRIDWAINGFIAVIERLAPDFDCRAWAAVAKKLDAGVLLTVKEIDACFAVINAAEDLLLEFSREQLVNAAKQK